MRHYGYTLTSRSDSDRPSLGQGISTTVPTGTLPVAVGLMISGLAAYGYLAVSAHLVGPRSYAALSAQWALVLLVGPGIFNALEQEVGRALAARRAVGLGGRPVVVRSAIAGFVGLLICLALCVGIGRTLTHRLFDDDSLLFIGSLIGLCGYYVQYEVRGILAGAGRFRLYSGVVAVEGMLRFLPCLLLAFLGERGVGAYGLVFGLAPLTAVIVVACSPRPLAAGGPRSSWSELSSALGYLVVGSLLSQGLINRTPLAVKLLAAKSQEAVAGRVLAGLIVARVPLFLFGALQASLLPSLSRQAAAQDWHHFRRGLLRLLAAVMLLGLASTLGAFSLGPVLLPVLFGPRLCSGAPRFRYLGRSKCDIYGRSRPRTSAHRGPSISQHLIAWSSGLSTLLVLLTVQGALVVRVERSFLLGALVAAVTMTILTVAALRNPSSVLTAEEVRGLAPPERP